MGCAGQTSQIYGGPTSQLTGLKGSAANILVPDTTAHLQGSGGVHGFRAGLAAKEGPCFFLFFFLPEQESFAGSFCSLFARSKINETLNGHGSSFSVILKFGSTFDRDYLTNGHYSYNVKPSYWFSCKFTCCLENAS